MFWDITFRSRGLAYDVMLHDVINLHKNCMYVMVMSTLPLINQLHISHKRMKRKKQNLPFTIMTYTQKVKRQIHLHHSIVKKCIVI